MPLDTDRSEFPGLWWNGPAGFAVSDMIRGASRGRSRTGAGAVRTPKGFADFSSPVARTAGRPSTFATSIGLIVVWAVTGPLFGYSDAWQLVINTGTTIVTFLMVFLIQNTQNRDGAAIQAKLDELIRASAAQNRFIGIENLTEEELDDLRARLALHNGASPGAIAEAADQAEAAADAKAREAAARIAGAPSYPS